MQLVVKPEGVFYYGKCLKLKTKSEQATSSPKPPNAKLLLRWQVYRLASLIGKVVRFQLGGPTDELHPFTKSSETGLG